MRLARKYQLAVEQETQGGTYHCVSRVVWRQFIFKRAEKEFFRKTMRMYEQYCGVKVLSYCIMSNHVHILVKVPPAPKHTLSDAALIERLELIYSEAYVSDVKRWLAQCRAISNKKKRAEAVQELKERYTKRMWNLSEFMKAVKQKFTQWYNKRMGCTGTLWEGRFKSQLIQDGEATRTLAAYIDLNPVRAGMVKDPKDYRWSSYGESCAGVELAQQRLLEVMETLDTQEHVSTRDLLDWEKASSSYRMLLVEGGMAVDQEADLALGERKSKRHKKRHGFSAKEAEKILEQNGKLTRSQLLHCKVRYFTDGVVLGSREYVEKFFKKMKETRATEHEKRLTGARKMRNVKEQTLFTMRDLRKDAIRGSS